MATSKSILNELIKNTNGNLEFLKSLSEPESLTLMIKYVAAQESLIEARKKAKMAIQGVFEGTNVPIPACLTEVWAADEDTFVDVEEEADEEDEDYVPTDGHSDEEEDEDSSEFITESEDECETSEDEEENDLTAERDNNKAVKKA